MTKSYSTPLEKLEDICFNLGNLHNGRGSLFDVAGNQQSKTEVKIGMFLEFPFFFFPSRSRQRFAPPLPSNKCRDSQVNLALNWLIIFMHVCMFHSSKIISRKNAAINRNFHLKIFCLDQCVETFGTSKQNFVVVFISRGLIAQGKYRYLLSRQCDHHYQAFRSCKCS